MYELILYLPTDGCSARQSDKCDTPCSCKDQQINESTGISAFIFIVRVLCSEETIKIQSHPTNPVLLPNILVPLLHISYVCRYSILVLFDTFSTIINHMAKCPIIYYSSVYCDEF